MMALRLSRIALVGSVAVFFVLIAFGNITDYPSNFAFVQHVLAMDTTFKSPNLMWRAIAAPWVHHAAYLAIIAWQVLTALLLVVGTLRLWQARSAGRVEFAAARSTAILGLTAGFVLYGLGFIAVGGEWFSMWQSQTWNGQRTAGIFLVFIGFALVHLCGPDGEG